MSARKPSAESETLTGISRFCLGTMEASWLATVIIVPLFYNPYSLRGFQFNKEAFLRLAAIVSFASLVVWSWEKVAATDQETRRDWWRRLFPLACSLGLLMLSYLISTCLSVYPYISLWGSDQHQEGAFTFVCDVVLLVAVAVGLRTDEQVNRLVTTILVTSIPLSIYALMQKAGLDPNDFPLPDNRACSLVGHPIYLGAYLTMVMPVTVWRILTLVPLHALKGFKLSLKTWAFFFYIGVLFLQLGGFICTSSRGPFLALIATALFLFVGLTAYWNNRRAMISGLVVVGVLGVCFALLSLAISFSKYDPDNESLGRFVRLLPTNGDDFRNQFWSQAPKLIFAAEPLPYPDGSKDTFHVLRPLFGYGPETLMNALPHLFFWPGTEAVFEDRFHNIVWDTWASLGGFGIAAFLFFVLLLFDQSLGSLGLQISNRTRYVYWLMVPGLGLAGSIVFGLYLQAYIGLGLVVGLVAGLGAYWLFSFLFRRSNSPSCVMPSDKARLLIALLAVMAGHLIEISFAYTTPSTNALFWVFAGVIVALGQGSQAVGESEATALTGKQLSSKRSMSTSGFGVHRLKWSWPALSTALMLITVLFGFMFTVPYPEKEQSLSDVLTLIFLQTRLEHNPSYLIWFLLVPAWVFSSFAFAADPYLKEKTKGFDATLGLTLLMSGMIAVGYALCRAAQIWAIGPIPNDYAPTSSALSQGLQYQMIFLLLLTLVLGFIGAGGWMLQPVSSRSGPHRLRSIIILGAANGAALGFAWLICLNPVRANMMAEWGSGLEQQDRVRQSVDVFRDAISITPGDAEYHRMLSDAYMLMTTKAASNDAIDPFLSESEKQLVESKKLTSGLDACDNELATLYLEWASIEKNPDKQLQLAGKARAAFEQALVFEPGYAVAWTDRAAVDALYLKDSGDAKASLKKASELEVGLSPSDWGGFYRDRILKVGNPNLKYFYGTHALDLYDQQMSQVHGDKNAIALCHVAKSKVYLEINNDEGALSECLAALKISPDVDSWNMEATLAQIYIRTGDRNDALRCLEKAIAAAPPEQQDPLRGLRASLQ